MLKVVYRIHLLVMKHTSDSNNNISDSNVLNFPMYVTQGFKGSRAQGVEEVEARR